MATKKPEAPAEENVQEKAEFDPWKIEREVYVHRTPGEDKTLPVCINDRNYAVPKGQRVMVPLPVYEVICNMQDQMEKTEAEAEEQFVDHQRGVIR